MISKGFLLVRPASNFLARPVGNLIQRRGKAIQNWKRPTMDDYLGPKEPWELVNARRNKEGNYYLLAGVSVMLSAIIVAIQLDFIDLAPDPLKWKDVKDMKG